MPKLKGILTMAIVVIVVLFIVNRVPFLKTLVG